MGFRIAFVIQASIGGPLSNTLKYVFITLVAIGCGVITGELKGAEGMSRDGLRAVAHLGGKTGMIKYVQSGGKYNPADDFGTKLSDYYNKFK